MKYTILSIYVGLCICTLPLTAANPKKVTDQDVDALYHMMMGSFSSQAQSVKDTSYFDIRLHMAPVWTDRKGEYWLYVEQAMAAKLEKPYRQRVYHLVREGDSLIKSTVYNFKGDALRFAGEWKKDKPLANVVIDSLEAREGCVIFLHKTGSKKYEGATHANDCVSNLRGASYATSEAHITPSGMVSWDRGWDKAGKHVWGAEKGGYKFRKIKN
jgi:CpeT protein